MSNISGRFTKRQLLDFLDHELEPALGAIVYRWEDGVSPHIRAEIMSEAWEPLLRILIQVGRRPHPRQ